MNTWKIKSSHYYSHNSKRRDLEFNLEGVTIITGESSTGKSAVIDTVNYCLGSSDCDIGNFIEDRCSHVAILLTNGEQELFICRKMPVPGQKASGKMQVLNGTSIVIPKCSDDLRLTMNLETSLLNIQGVLGIGEVKKTGDSGSKVSIRNTTPYIFLNDETIISKRLSLYGLAGQKAKTVIDSYPYFIGAITEETLSLERELFGLNKGVELEEKRQEKVKSSYEQVEKDADNILYEAINLGIIEKDTLKFTFQEKLDLLITINSHTNKKPPSKTNSIYNELNKEKRQKLKELDNLEKELDSGKELSTTAKNFSTTLSSQKDSVEAVSFFKDKYGSSSCPLCENNLTSPNDILLNVNASYKSLTAEVGLAETRLPKIERYIDDLLEKIESQRQDIVHIEDKLKVIVKENAELSRAEDRYSFIERLKGKITFFLEQQARIKLPTLQSTKYREYVERIKDIKSMLDPELINEQIKAADSEVSQYATEYLGMLPTSVPCNGNKVYFSSKKMTLSILQSKGSLIPLNKIKSDQNYLALHVSLILALQKELQNRQRPVPGFVFIDQVSRPYYPSDKNDEYKKEIKLKSDSEDKEVLSVKSYFDLFFKATELNKNLQLIILEHAYFENDERYKKSVKYRWTEETLDKLIPEDWPTYEDIKGN